MALSIKAADSPVHSIIITRMDTPARQSRNEGLLPALFFASRLILFLSLIPDNWRGFGDLSQYFTEGGGAGWPYINYWMEYPPIMPFVNAAVYRLAGGSPFLFDLILCILYAVAGAAGLIVFRRLAGLLWDEESAARRTVVYFALIVPLPYTWWYMELIPVFLMLLGMYAILRNTGKTAGAVIGIGALVKWFPAFILPAAWRLLPRKRAVQITAIATGLVILVFGGLYLISPQMTQASLISQPSRSSWQTIWALIDGNYHTGEYILPSDRYDPTIAGIARDRPARIPLSLTLVIFGAAGLWILWRARIHENALAFIAMVGVTWVLFLLWSPGWSPQWILYLLPLILLTLSERRSVWLALALIFITLLEWPTFLKHNLWDGLWIVVPARMAVFLVLLWNWARQTRSNAT